MRLVLIALIITALMISGACSAQNETAGDKQTTATADESTNPEGATVDDNISGDDLTENDAGIDGQSSDEPEINNQEPSDFSIPKEALNPPPVEVKQSGNWPESIVIPPDFSILSSIENALGGICEIYVVTTMDIDQLASYFTEQLEGWEKGWSVPMPQMGGEVRQLSLYNGSNTFQLEATSSGEKSPVNVKLTYNWITSPGTLPEGWPEDIKIMPALETKYGFMDQDGFRNAILRGPAGSLDSVATYYTTSMAGWTSMSPSGSPAVTGNSLSLIYRLGKRMVRISGQTVGDENIYWLATGDMKN